jgi:hypothetical protein
MVTVNIYHNSVPNKKNLEKIELLTNFSQGVKVINDRAVDIHNYQYTQSDVAVIQGWLGDKNITSQHLMLRKNVIEGQLKSGNYVVAVDSNLFLYANTKNPQHYLRYSFNGIFPNTGIFCDSNVDPARWKKISKNLGINLRDYRTAGNHILLLLQRNGGWSMGGKDIQDWANETIAELRKYTDRPIVIRPHPGDKTSKEIVRPDNPHCRIKFSNNVTLSNNLNLIDDLKNCWAAINYNSSPVVGAAIEGYPIFVTDTGKSQCAEIANTDLSLIETPILYNRQDWVNRLSMFHWNFDELKSGECWNHMKQFISI